MKQNKRRAITAAGTLFAVSSLLFATATSALAAEVTEQKAKDIALAHAGYTAEDVFFTQSELDYDDGRRVYELEFYAGENKEYDYEIDSSTGDILSYSQETHISRQESSGSGAKRQSAVTSDQAKAMALKQADLSEADVIRFTMKEDFDDGRFVYEGKFFYGETKYEFEIDSQTGILTDWDAESIYD